MFRLTAAFLFVCSFTVHLVGQQAAPSPGAANQKQPAVPPAVAASPTSGTPFVIDTLKEWSAIMVGSFLPEDERESHIYRSGNLVRTEGMEGHGYYLTDLSTQDTHHVWTSGCSRDKHVYFRAIPWASTSRPGYKVTRLPAGKEMLDGHSCQVEEVTVGGDGVIRPIRMKLWEAEDLQGFPIKIEYIRRNGRNKVVRYKNVYVGPQDPTLFIHPTECESPVDEQTEEDEEGNLKKSPTVKVPMSKPSQPAPSQPPKN
jgi:hypothetical protein